MKLEALTHGTVEKARAAKELLDDAMAEMAAPESMGTNDETVFEDLRRARDAAQSAEYMAAYLMRKLGDRS